MTIKKYYENNKKTKQYIIMIDQRITISNALINMFKSYANDWDFLTFRTVREAINQTYITDRNILFILNIGGIKSSENMLEEHMINIRDVFPNAPIIILADNEKLLKPSLFSYLKLNGFITTNNSPALLTACIHLVILGGFYIPKTLVLNSISTKFKTSNNKKIIANFTPRQRQVALLLYQGLANKVIAKELSITESTVKTHISIIMKKLGVTNRTQASKCLS